MPHMPLQRNQGFYYHKVTDEVALDLMEDIRSRYITLAMHIEAVCLENRERGLALTALEESLMRSIQSLALSFGERQEPASQ